jgi:hypothetical protein
MTCADNRHAAGTCDVPVTLEIKQLYRMFGVTQFGRILAGTMHANAEVLDAGGTDSTLPSCQKWIDDATSAGKPG